MMIADQIRKDLTVVLKKLKINSKKLVLEHPAEVNYGDYATNIALIVKSEIAPYDLANKIVNTWRSQGLPEYLAKIEVVKPGFINLSLENKFLITQIQEVIKKKRFTKNKAQKGVMVEFAHPNTHKQFHLGHLRNLCLGEAICRILIANKNEIYRVNYQGDVGLHVAK